MADEVTISQVLNALRPGAEWTCLGGTYAGLLWTDAVQSKPTEAEWDAKLVELQAAAVTNDARKAAIVADSTRVDILNRMKTQTNAEIEAWLRGWLDADGVTNLATAITFCKRVETSIVTIVKAISLDIRNGS